VHLNYNTADTAAIAKLTLLNGVEIDNVQIVGANNHEQVGIRFDKCRSPKVNDYYCDNLEYIGIAFDRCYGSKVNGGGFNRARLAGLAYGITFQNGCYGGSVVSATGFDLRHLVTVGDNDGINYFISANNCFAYACADAGFDSHPSGDHIDFSYNFVECAETNTTDGIVMQCLNAKATNNKVINAYRHSVFYQPLQEGLTGSADLSHNECYGRGAATTSVGVYAVADTAGASINGLTMNGNKVKGHLYHCHIFANTQSIEDFSMNGNVSLEENATSGCRAGFLRAGSGVTLKNGVVNGNNFKVGTPATSECLYLFGTTSTNITDITIVGNQLKGGNIGLRGVLTDSLTIGANAITGATTKMSIAGTANNITQDVSGVSADNGDAAATLTVGTSVKTQLWNTALTANRAVTLSTTSAYEGATFRVVRGASATGAFNLNVGTGPLKALASASTWCDVVYDGSAWILEAYGTL
jgi:hypothetical protein